MSDLGKYAKLLGVSPHAELSEIKGKYAEWRQKFEKQLRSDDIAKAQKGQKNLMLLDQAYQALAAHAASAARRDERESADQASALSIEIGTHRAGFNINNLEGFQFMDQSKVRRFKISWPGAKVTFFNNKLKIKALIFSTEIEYRHIEEIKRYFFMPFVFEIRHRAPDVMPTVVLYGPGLGGKIKRLNEEHHLNLPISF